MNGNAAGKGRGVRSPQDAVGDYTSPMAVARILALILAALLVARVAGVGVPVPALAAFLALLLLQVALRAMSLEPSTRLRWLRDHRFELAVGALALLAVLLQLNGLWLDIGHTPLDIDENRLASTVRVFFDAGEIPHRTVEDYPGIFYWLAVGAYLPAFLWALLSGTAVTFGGLSQEFLVLVGRGLNVPLYATTVILTAALGWRLEHRSRAIGIGAAALMAFSSLGLRITGQFRNEAAVLVLVAAALVASMALLSEGRLRLAALAGALAGLACGVKYTGVFALLPVLGAAAWRREGESKWKLATAGTVGFVVALGISNPFLWLDFPNFVEQLSFEVASAGSGVGLAAANPSWFYTRTLAASFGVPAMLIAGAVAIVALARPLAELRLLLLFALPYQLFMTRQPQYFERWVYPLLPVVACLVAWGAVRGYRLAVVALATRTSNLAARTVLAVGLVLIVLGPSLSSAAVLASRRTAPTTFQHTLDWLHDNVDEGETVLTGASWLDTRDAPYRVVRVPDLGSTINRSPLMMATYDWLVVPEPEFEIARVALAGREPEARIRMQLGFGGNLGFDFDIFRPPVPQLLQRGWELDPAADDAGQYLGSGWDHPGQHARVVGGVGELFLPLRPQRGYILTVVGGPDERGGPSGMRVSVNVNGVWVIPDCLAKPESGPEDWECGVILPAEQITDRVDRVALMLGSTEPVAVHRIEIAPGARLRKARRTSAAGASGSPLSASRPPPG